MPRPRNATLLLIGDGFSAFGGWIDFLAILALAAWQFQVSPLQMALAYAVIANGGEYVPPTLSPRSGPAPPRGAQRPTPAGSS